MQLWIEDITTLQYIPGEATETQSFNIYLFGKYLLDSICQVFFLGAGDEMVKH